MAIAEPPLAVLDRARYCAPVAEKTRLAGAVAGKTFSR
jgi:hypothetical protein